MYFLRPLGSQRPLKDLQAFKSWFSLVKGVCVCVWVLCFQGYFGIPGHSCSPPSCPGGTGCRSSSNHQPTCCWRMAQNSVLIFFFSSGMDRAFCQSAAFRWEALSCLPLGVNWQLIEQCATSGLRLGIKGTSHGHLSG